MSWMIRSLSKTPTDGAIHLSVGTIRAMTKRALERDKQRRIAESKGQVLPPLNLKRRTTTKE